MYIFVITHYKTAYFGHITLLWYIDKLEGVSLPSHLIF